MATAAQKKTTDLVPIGDYSVVSGDGAAELSTIIEENVGGGAITPFDLDRIKIPAGGGLSWVVPTLDGETDERSIEGIIVHWREPRAYWSTSLDESGGGTPPDCASDDGQFGVGAFGPGSDENPTGACASCPMARFGSADKGGGQACKQSRLLFVLRPDAILPVALALPPTSIKPARTYFLRLANARLPFYGVTTVFTLERTKNAAGIDYGRVVLTKGETLDDAQRKSVEEYRESIRQSLDAVRLEASDVHADEDLVDVE